MAFEIRAMSFTEILDGGFRIVRDHAAVLLAIPFVIYLPLYLATAFLETDPARATEPATLAILAGVMLVFALAVPVASAAVIQAVGEAALGRGPEIGECLRTAFERFLPLLGTSILWFLVVLVGFILLVIPGLYATVAFLLAFEVVVLERRGGWQALKRSHELMKGSMWRGLGIMVLASVIGGLVQNVLILAAGFIPFASPIVSAFASALVMAYTTAVLVLLYFDRRCRKEAFDLEHLAAQVEGRPAPAGPAPA